MYSAHEIAYINTRTIDVPRDLFRENRIVSAFNPCLLTDAYKILSTQVSLKLRANDWRTLGVTSPGRREGKPLTAINLAISLAAEFNQTALLVDAHLRRPNVSQYFGVPAEAGLSDYLMSNRPIETVDRPGRAGLVFLLSGAPLINSSEALGRRRMARSGPGAEGALSRAHGGFRSDPFADHANVLALAPYLDAALMVVEEGRPSRRDVDRAVRLLNETQLISTVLNKSNEIKLRVEKPAGWLRTLLGSHRKADCRVAFRAVTTRVRRDKGP